ncbi:MAG: polysaccharide biosynthesis C-terminal domain-containing protein [Candidatus Thermoplasmatota archaeon]
MSASNAGRKATLVLLANLAGAALGYASLLLIGRYFAPAAYGAYLFALSITGLVSVLSNLGLGIAHQRHVAQGVDPGRAFGVLARLRLAIAVPVLAAGAIAYAIWTAAKGQAVTDATTPLVLGLALTVQLLAGARQSLFDTWQGQQRVNRIELAKGLDTFLVVVLLANAALLVAHLQGRWEIVPGVGAFWAGVLGLDAPLTVPQGAALLATSYVLAKGVSFLLALGWWLTDGIRMGPWDRDLARAYLRFAMPLALVGGLTMVLQYTDTLLLGFLWTAREVGLYGAAQRLSSLCLLGALAVGTVLFPRFATLHAVGDRDGERATFERSERYLLVLAAPLAAAMVALPRQGLHVAVGDAYLDAAVPLQLLALWALVIAMEQPISSRLMGTGSLSPVVRTVTINAVGNVLLNLLLVPRFGPSGSGVATLVSTAVAYLYLRHKGRQAFAIPWIEGHQVRTLTSALLAGAFWKAGAIWTGAAAFDRFWKLGAWGLSGLIVYAFVLAALGGIRREDLAFLRRVGHPSALLDELRGR